jgi:hypothetical protein
MKKSILLLLLTVFTISLFAYSVGDVVSDDFSWTDNNGEAHSVHQLINSGKAIVFFWGNSG